MGIASCPNDDCSASDIDVVEVELGQERGHQLSAFACSTCNTIIGIEQYRNAPTPKHGPTGGRVADHDSVDADLRCPACGNHIIPETGSSYRVSPFTHHRTQPDWADTELCPECGVILGTTTHV